MDANSRHITISERKIYLRVFDVVFAIAGLYWLDYLFSLQYFTFSNSNIGIWIGVLAFYLVFFGEIFEMYNLQVASDKYLTLRSTLITIIFTALFFVFTPILTPILPQNRIDILYFVFALLVAVGVNRFIYIAFIFSPRFFKNVLIIADTQKINEIIGYKNNNKTFKIAAYVSDVVLEEMHNYPFFNIKNVDLATLLKDYGINEILVCSEKVNLISPQLNNQLIELFEKGISIKSTDTFTEEELFRISETKLKKNFYNHFTFSKSHQNNMYLVFRRFLDIIFALLGIVFMVFLLPLMLLGNAIANRGPLFYFQNRVGKGGKLFAIIKFRSMNTNAEKEGAVWAKPADVRVTPFGRVLRKSRLDEVPQFINVLKGDMSLIGPRPERPEFLEKLEQELPFYSIRHVIKPGLTGWAQVMHPYAHTIADQHKKLLYDLYYIKERNLILDLKIVIKTISTVLFLRGT